MADDGEEVGAPTPVAIQARVLDYWERTGLPARTVYGTPDGRVFRFTEGPPTANGRPHLGHPEPRTLKDVQLRYRRMRGHRIVSAMAGWDCHGLPVELEIEKRHGLKSKKEIEAFGVARFCEECRASTLLVADAWREMSRRLGYWLDYDHAYRTMDPPFMESVWWSLKTLFDRGLLEKGHYVLPYCPRCETPISSHEVAQGYRDTTDPSVTVRFPLVDPPGAKRSLLVWTTTPWTLPSNLLVAVRADLEYSVVRTADGEELVLASTAVPRYFPHGADVVERTTGDALAGRQYAPPFATPGPGPGRYRVVRDEFVTTEDGTGIVHIAPSFGPEDQRVGAREGVGVYDPLDSRGVFTDKVPLVHGKGFKAADPILTKDLAERGLLFRSETLRHTYPHCWRCDSALLYRAIDSWFVRTSRFSDRLVAANAQVRWVPAHLRDGRFGNFLEEAKDWALSRNRYWGTPLPIWVCAEGHFTCVGSFAELAERTGAPLPVPFDPHRETVDRLTLRCGRCGGAAKREPYTIDGWYDSGSAPFAQFHYPFEPGPFDPAAPLDYIAEAIDQTRGWYYTLLVLAVALFDRPAYRVCLTTGHVLDDQGRKMSKSKGNALEPLSLLERMGGDAVRWSFLVVDFTEGLRISEASIQKTAARTLGTLSNAVAFHLGNARSDRLAPATERPAPTAPLDRWLLSRLEGTRASVEASLEAFDPRPGATAIRAFVDDLSTWYLRRSRPRFWGETTPDDRRAAHATLSYALLGFARTIAPFVPFTAEWIHQEVGELAFRDPAASVHAAPWPGPLADRDPALEQAMEELRALAEVGRELRQRAGVRSRIPLPTFAVLAPASPALAALRADGERLLAEELNVRAVVWSAPDRRGDFPDADWVVRDDDGAAVAALSRRPTEALRAEGMVREVGRRLQQTRKELGLKLDDRIRVELSAGPPLFAALAQHRATLVRELLATDLELTDRPLAPGPDVRSWDVDGVSFSARVVPA
ncbi:MAG TPA: isoleucine--tRNA ligase [Thermoplasmata archaeon]|nr:isoleucine--tRNA ligase [Thermoplasmata archaeon]